MGVGPTYCIRLEVPRHGCGGLVRLAHEEALAAPKVLPILCKRAPCPTPTIFRPYTQVMWLGSVQQRSALALG